MDSVTFENPALVDKRYDLVLYGATGFVGRQATAYLARHLGLGHLRWAAILCSWL